MEGPLARLDRSRDELAKAWLVRLIERASLDEIKRESNGVQSNQAARGCSRGRRWAVFLASASDAAKPISAQMRPIDNARFEWAVVLTAAIPGTLRRDGCW